jgi:hypothetical protein
MPEEFATLYDQQPPEEGELVFTPEKYPETMQSQKAVRAPR